jgi:hypothetical protein
VKGGIRSTDEEERQEGIEKKKTKSEKIWSKRK